MKSFKTAIIAIVVLAVAITGYFIAKGVIQKNSDKGEESSNTGTGVTVLSFNADDVVKIESKDSESFVLIKTESGSWQCESPADLKLGSDAVSDVLTTINNMTGTCLFAKGEFDGNLADYGLDNPSLFTLTMSDGSKTQVKIGGMNPAGTMYYVMIEGSDEIFTVNTIYGKRLKLTRNLLISGNLIELSDTSKLKTIEIKKKGETECIFEADFSAGGDSSKAWNITYPIKMAGNTSVIDSLGETLTGLTVFDVLEADCEDLSKYGLDVPEIQYILTDNKVTATCEFGYKTSDGEFYYCTINGGKDVYRLDADNINFTDNTVLAYAYPYAFFETYTTLSSIDIEIFGSVNETRTLTFQFGDDNAELLSLDGVPSVKQDAEGNTVYDYLYEIKGITTYCYALQIDGLDVSSTLPKGDLACRITYHRQDGSQCVVEAYERDEATVYLYVDGEYMGGYCDSWRIFSETDHQGLWGTIKAYEALMAKA